MRLFAATICRKAMSLCAKENQKSFEQKKQHSKHRHFAKLQARRPNHQKRYSRATIRPSSFTCMAAWHRPCKARPRRSPRGMLGYVTNRFKRGNETQWKLKPARSDGWVMLSPSASDLYVILINLQILGPCYLLLFTDSLDDKSAWWPSGPVQLRSDMICGEFKLNINTSCVSWMRCFESAAFLWERPVSSSVHFTIRP